MYTNWDEVQREIFPIKDFEDLSRRLHKSFEFPFVRQVFNFTLSDLIDLIQNLLGGDPRGRYMEYASHLTKIINLLEQAGIPDLITLKEQTADRELMELFAERSKIFAHEIASVLKFLVYWLIPTEKYLGSLVRDDPDISKAIGVLSVSGIRTNLELLQAGITAPGRKQLAASSGLPEPVITELVNRADFSRMPWASKATISNIIGAGYSSIAQLANGEPEQVYADFFDYGKSIGKNLKLGNEIENSYRIAKIIPILVK